MAVVGAGWAGLAAAVRAVQQGHHVTLFEASRSLGGRARGVEATLPSGQVVTLDNGQHVLIGAYVQTLDLMRSVGVNPSQALFRLPLRLGVLQTKPWSWLDYFSLVRWIIVQRWRGFQCSDDVTVQDLCAGLREQVRRDIIDALCLSALNTAPHEASGRVFLRVLKDAFAERNSSDLLIPKTDLTSMLPSHVVSWLQERGSGVRLGARVASLQALQNEFDHIVVATPPWEATRLLCDFAPEWVTSIDELDYRAIATVYAQAPADFVLPEPMMALASDAQNPAQFVFQRYEAKGLLAFVVSAAEGARDDIEKRVLAQGEAKLGVALQPVVTFVEKRATFACTAKMKRPAKLSLAGLSVVGDYVEGPYPSTLEGAVRSTSKLHFG